MKQKEINKEQLEFVVHASKNHLLNFCEAVNPNYDSQWFHEVIAQKLEEALDAAVKGEKKRIILSIPPRHGKEILSSEDILTTKGWKKHGDLCVGDYVYHPSGKAIKVLANIPQTQLSNLEVEINDGSKIIVHPNHEWTVYDTKTMGRKLFTYETKNMLGNEWIGKKGKRGSRRRFQLPHNNILNFKERETLIDPYTFGYYIGNGTTDDNKLITFNPLTYKEVLKNIPYKILWENWHKTNNVPRFRLDIPKQKFIKKYIPDEYLFNSEKKRRELLAGLIDSDGCIDKTGRIKFSNTNKDVIDSVEFLVRSLGYYPNINKYDPVISTSGIIGRKIVYEVDFVNTDGKMVSKIKQNKFLKTSIKRKRAIVSIKKVKGGKGNCIQVDSPDGLYLAGRTLIPTHNSQLASIYFPAWALGKYPHLKFILSTYGAELAERHGKETRDLIDSPAYKTIFPNTKLVQDMKSRANWMVESKLASGMKDVRKGQYYAVGVGGALTGVGGHILILDDIHKDRAEAESETMRKAVWDYYRSTLYSRKEGEGAIIVIMQRWRQDDLVGLLLEEDEKLKEKGEKVEGWEVINFPAIAEEDEYIDGKLVRKEGKPLWENKFPISVLDTIKVQSLYYWASQWMQNPILAETAEFKKEYFKYYTDEDIKFKNLRYYTLVDPAISQKKSADNSVVLTIAKEVGGPNMYRIREDAGKYTPQQLVDLVFVHNNLYHSDVWIETIAYQEALKYMIQERQRKDQVYFVIREIKVHSAKETRIRGLLGLYQNGVIWHRAGSDVNYELELMAFPRGRRDDRIDAQSFILIAMDDSPSHSAFAKQFKPKWASYGKKR